MLCDVCKKNEATFHYTSVVNGVKQEMHLCADCAKAKGIGFNDFNIFGKSSEPFSFLPDFSMQDFVGGFLNPQSSKSYSNDVCPTCGMSRSEFKQGRLGCKDCYTYFKNDVQDLLTRMYGNSEHKGKVPKIAKSEMSNLREIEGLKKQLAMAINNEDFEQAAILRDKIRKMSDEGDDKNV